MRDAWSFFNKVKNFSQEEWQRYQREVPLKLEEAAVKVETPELKLLILYLKYFWEMFFDESYRIEAKTKLIILAGILYFVLPGDIISDFLPFLGFLDDAFVFRLIWEFIGEEVRRYASYKGYKLPEVQLDIKTLLEKKFGVIRDLFKISPFLLALKLENKVEDLENLFYISREFFKHNRLANVLRGKLYFSESFLNGVIKELPRDLPVENLRVEVRGDELWFMGKIDQYNLDFRQKINMVNLTAEKDRILIEFDLKGMPQIEFKGAWGFLYRFFAPVAGFWGIRKFIKLNQHRFPGITLEGSKLKVDLSFYLKPDNLKVMALLKFAEKLPPLTAVPQNGLLVVKINE
ncbi:YkvA family protein [Carboxydothermus ferrireducens]|uniref:Uncharacterized membrane protein YkvA (DUF1232 family) n=1 Tax=Carboxydothermus ferrireducens DSM 11255 TaxID=1119529 RepID=A0ABX2RBG1_9THEO|nr:YkvA family protein [Carboxydothermus ferrireducens]NYE57403.1 uncharacterized membrane protein YkvA (DUF1232 family) [Carboxydothermus ferrireducens DSM 11255]